MAETHTESTFEVRLNKDGEYIKGVEPIDPSVTDVAGHVRSKLSALLSKEPEADKLKIDHDPAKNIVSYIYDNTKSRMSVPEADKPTLEDKLDEANKIIRQAKAKEKIEKQIAKDEKKSKDGLMKKTAKVIFWPTLKMIDAAKYVWRNKTKIGIGGLIGTAFMPGLGTVIGGAAGAAYKEKKSDQHQAE